MSGIDVLKGNTLGCQWHMYKFTQGRGFCSNFVMHICLYTVYTIPGSSSMNIDIPVMFYLLIELLAPTKKT